MFSYCYMPQPSAAVRGNTGGQTERTDARAAARCMQLLGRVSLVALSPWT